METPDLLVTAAITLKCHGCPHREAQGVGVPTRGREPRVRLREERCPCRRKCGRPREEGGPICSRHRLWHRCRAVVSSSSLEVWGGEPLGTNALTHSLWRLVSDAGFSALATVPSLSERPRLPDQPLLCALDGNALRSKSKSLRPGNRSLGWPGDDCHLSFGNIETRAWTTLASEGLSGPREAGCLCRR